MYLRRYLVPALVVTTCLLGPVAGQDAVVTVGPNGEMVQAVAAPSQPGSTPVPGVPPGGAPGAPTPPGAPGGEKKAGDGKDQSAAPKVIRRDQVAGDSAAANRDEFQAMVGEDGRVAFEFRNQPWVDLIQWLADISHKPLDWLELPGDRVNLRSPGRYTVEETRDLFNRYLLARGFTLLELDGGLTVAKTETINPAIVPRVDASELDSLPPHSFVRTSLDVGWLSSEKLSKELAPMISANGKLTALTTTNRIEAMDAAVNLRQVAMLLEQERSSASLEALAPEFKLRYLPAQEAKLMLEQFLGVEKKKDTPMTPQQIQMMQQMQNQNPNAQPQGEPKQEISIVANTRQNSVIVRAPADRTAVAMEFLKRIDVPSESMASLADVQNRVQVFRLASLDPEKLIEILGEMNVLEPTTRVRTDKDNNALIVSGSAADRFIIDSLIKRLDGSGRSFEVLPLRRLDPVEVAESIAFLMGQKEEKEQQNTGRRYYYDFFGGQEEQKKKGDEFRVAANARYRQVLLWANDQEMDEVRNLLVKLGELPPEGGSRSTVRLIEASATPETLEYLQRLRQQWNRLSPNPLELPDEALFREPNAVPASGATEETDEAGDDESKASPNPVDRSRSLDNELTRGSFPQAFRLTATQNDSIDGSDEKEVRDGDSSDGVDISTTGQGPAETLPPIQSAEDFRRAFQDRDPSAESDGKNGLDPSRNDSATLPVRGPAAVRIEVDRSGNLMLVSPDTQALDQLENLMLQITPPKRPYQVFHIHHASAAWMRLNLEDYFKDLDAEDSNSDQFFQWYFGFNDQQQDDKNDKGLGKGNKLRFVDDPDTNTLVVNGATSEQLRTIAELIELWDVPEPVNKRKTRFTRLVKVQYGTAEKIAETVKEAYRDLLSSNDKAFSAPGGGQQQPGGGGGGNANNAPKSRNGNGSGLENSERGQDGGGTDFSFKGKLSIGIDSIGNTLLVSAEGEPLLELVADMIVQLDEAARPQGVVQVLKLSGNLSSESLQNALRPVTGNAAASPAAPPTKKDVAPPEPVPALRPE